MVGRRPHRRQVEGRQEAVIRQPAAELIDECRNALLAGRFAVSPADILRVARPVLRHRILPNFAAEAKGISAEQIIDRLLEDVKPPKSEIKL